MPNTNPQAVKIANEGFRKLSDKLMQAFFFSRFLKEKIAADGIDNLFTADKDVIEDGSAEDGRSPMTNEDVKMMIGGLDTLIAFFDANPDLRDTLLRLSVNPTQF